MKKGILLHEADDDVGVATMDLTAGEVVQAVTLDGDAVTDIELVDDVPLAHKVAARAMDANHDVIEYGRVRSGPRPSRSSTARTSTPTTFAADGGKEDRRSSSTTRTGHERLP